MSSASMQHKAARLSFPWAWLLLGVFVGAALMALALMNPAVRARLPAAASASAGEGGHGEHGEEGHDHKGHEHGAGDPNSVDLSEQARQNIGLTTAPVKLTTFERMVSIPAMVVERPGRSKVQVVAPLAGIVTRLYIVAGEAVVPGQPLFDLRLTHEEVVQAQAELLRTVEELDVVRREVARLEVATEGGVIAGKDVLARKYEQQKLEASLRAQQQSLVLHGISREQVDKIIADRSLLSAITVSVPRADGPTAVPEMKSIYQVQELNVDLGKLVNAGEPVTVLADHAELFLEGNAFEQDLAEITRAIGQGWPVTAVLESKEGKPEKIPDLKVLYLDGKVDPATRTFHFYVSLPNIVLRDAKDASRRFVYWQFRPGQRMQLLVPVERWENRIVLPVDAVAQEGVETFVFQPNGGKVTRRPVHVEYRDQYNAVIANDGGLFPGDAVATSSAHQLQLAIKSKSGGGPDPHAGHNH